MFAEHGLDLYDRDAKRNSTDLKPLGSYELDDPSNMHLLAEHPYIAASLTVLGVGSGIVSLVQGCVSFSDSSPVSQSSCILSVISNVITFTLSALNGYDNTQEFFAHLANNGIYFEPRWCKRDIESNPPLFITHEEYMEYFLDHAGVEATHAGFHERDGFVSPVYEFDLANGQRWNMHISRGIDGEVRHTLGLASHSKIETRDGYKDYTVIGGLDIKICQVLGGDYGDLTDSPEDAYDYIYADLECLVPEEDMVDSNLVEVDLMDRSGTVLMRIGMTPYLKDDDPIYVNQMNVCDGSNLHFDQNCVN